MVKNSQTIKFEKVRKSTIVEKNSYEFFECYKIKKLKNSKFNKFYNDLNKPKIICSINFGRVGSQFFFEILNKKLNIMCGYSLFNKRKKKKFTKFKKFDDFFLYSLRKINNKNVIFFEISPKRFLNLIKFVELETLKKFNYHIIFRKNILKQCLSYYVSLNTGIWFNYDKDKKEPGHLENLEYKKMKPKLFEILKNILLFEKKVYTFLRKNNFNHIKQNYESITKSYNHETNKFINFYKLKDYLFSKIIKKNYLIKKNKYEKKYNQIFKEFKNDISKNLLIKKNLQYRLNESYYL